MSEHIEHFATADVDQHERLGFWNRIASETFNGLSIDSSQESFNAEMWRWRLGDLIMTRPRSPNAVVHRNADIARQSGERVLLHMQHSGSCLHTQGKEVHTLRAGDFVLADSNRDYKVELLGANDMLVVEMPRAALAERVPQLQDTLSKRIRGDTPSSRLLHDFLLSLWRQGDQSGAEPHWLRGVSAVFFDLLSMAASDTDEYAVGDHKVMNKMMSLIETRICDPDLRTSALADELGVSIRTVQNAFAAIGETPSAYILDRRLTRAADRLVAAPQLSVTSVSYEVGFNDCSYFTRCFKQKYGVSPTAYRARH